MAFSPEQHVSQTNLVRPVGIAFSAEQHVTQTDLLGPIETGSDAQTTKRPGGIGALNVGWFPKPTMSLPNPRIPGVGQQPQETSRSEETNEEHIPQSNLFFDPVRPTREAAGSAPGRGRIILEWDHDTQTGLGTPTQPTNAEISPVEPNVVPTATQNTGFGSLEPFDVDTNGIGLWQGPLPSNGQPAPNAGPTAGLGANINPILPQQQGLPQVSGVPPSQNSVLPVASNPGQAVGQGTGQGEAQGTETNNVQSTVLGNSQGTGQTNVQGTETNNAQGVVSGNGQGTGQTNNAPGAVPGNGQGTGETNTPGTGTNNAQGVVPGNGQGTGQTNNAPGAVPGNGQGTGQTNNAPEAVPGNDQGTGPTNTQGTGVNNAQGTVPGNDQNAGQTNVQSTGTNAQGVVSSNDQDTGQTINAPGVVPDNGQGTGQPNNAQETGQVNGAAQPNVGSGLGANLDIGARPQSQVSPQIPGAQTPQSSVLPGTSVPIPGVVEPQGPEPVQVGGQTGASNQGEVPQSTVSAGNAQQTVANSGLIGGLNGIGLVDPGQTTPQTQSGSSPNGQQPISSNSGQVGAQGTDPAGVAGQSGSTVPVQGQNAGSTEGGVPGASSTQNPQQNGNTNPVQGGGQGDISSGGAGQTAGTNPVEGEGGSDTNTSQNTEQPGVPSQTQNGGEGGGSLPIVEPSTIPNQVQSGSQGSTSVPIANPNPVQSGTEDPIPSQGSQSASDSNQASNGNPSSATSSQTHGVPGEVNTGQNGLENSGVTPPAAPEQVPAFGNGGVGAASNTQQGETPASAGANLPVANPTTVSNSGFGQSGFVGIGADGIGQFGAIANPTAVSSSVFGQSGFAGIGADGIGQFGAQPTPVPNSESAPTGNSANSNAAANIQGVAVDGNTIVQDGSPVTISGNAVAISSGIIQVGSNRAPIPVAGPDQPTPSPVVVGGLTFSPLPKPAAALPTPPVVVAGQTIENDNGVVQVGGQTLRPGASPIDVGGTPVSLGSSNLVVGTSILPRPDVGTPVSNPVVGNVGDTPVQAVDGGVQIGSTTLTPGAAATISGVPVTLGNNDDVVIGDKTTTFSRAAPFFDSPLANLGNLPVEQVESGVRIGSSILVPGAAATIDNTPVSLGSNNNLIIGSSTLSFTPSPAASPNSPTPIATIASQPIVALPSDSGIQIGTSVLLPGAAATIAGTPVIVGSSNDLIIGSNTITYTPPSAAAAAAAVVTLGSTLITANSASEFVIEGQTLAPGNSPLVIASTTYSLPTSGSAIIINGVTSPLAIPTVSTAVNQILTLGPDNDETITRIPNGNIIIDNQTLSPAGPAATISGKPISIDLEGGIIVGSSTYTFPPFPTPTPIPTGHMLSDGGPAATFSGVAVSMDDGGLIVGSSTTVDLSSQQGAMITVGGTVLSAGPSGLVILGPGTTEEGFSRVRPTTTVVVGGKATAQAGAGKAWGAGGGIGVGWKGVGVALGVVMVVVVI